MFGAFVGVISGKYIFEEPLKEYFAEQKELQQAGTTDSIIT